MRNLVRRKEHAYQEKAACRNAAFSGTAGMRRITPEVCSETQTDQMVIIGCYLKKQLFFTEFSQLFFMSVMVKLYQKQLKPS